MKKLLKKFKRNRTRLFKFLAWQKLYGQHGHFRFYQLHLLKKTLRTIQRTRQFHIKVSHFVLHTVKNTVHKYFVNYIENEEKVIDAINKCNSGIPVQENKSRFDQIQQVFLTLKRRL